jgi:aldehyde dehydrogenase (NAD+)
MTGQRLTSFIDGAWTPVSGGEEVASTNPYRPAETIATAWTAGDAEVASAVTAARSQFPDWAGTAPVSRAARLNALADALHADADQLSDQIAREVGKPVAEARTEVTVAENVARYYAAHLQMADGETFPAPDQSLSYTSRSPVGVVAAITPFNFPLSIPAWKVIPALAYGCTVVWKPAPAAVGVAARLASALEAAGLGRTVNVLFGGAEVVNQIIDADIDAVSFTGSTAAGKSIAIRSLQRGKRYQCEMGGMNATVVMRDADLDRAASDCAQAAFGYAGQKCTATRRLIIERSIWEPFLTRLQAAVDNLSVGDPLAGTTSVGPVISEFQAAVLRANLNAATAAFGPALVRRAVSADGGHWADLAVVGPVSSSDDVARAEVFGPFAVAIPVDGVDQAITEVNSGRCGLSAAIYTQSLDNALAFARQTRAGLVRVNRTTTGLDLAVPFGGEGDSGLGPKELGTAARDFFTISRTVWLGR